MGGQPATPLPFMVVAASEAAVASEANAAAIAASVAAVAGRPDQQGVPNQLSPPAADGTRTVYGVRALHGRVHRPGGILPADLPLPARRSATRTGFRPARPPRSGRALTSRAGTTRATA